MKKVVSSVVFAAFCGMLAVGCGSGDKPASKPNAGDNAAVVTEAAVPAAEAAAVVDGSPVGQFLSEYEVFANEYVSVVKKMKAGDAPATQRLSELAEQVETWGDRMEALADQMTPEQGARFLEIMNKITAAMGM